MLIGLALAGYAFLFVPPFGGINIEPFRKGWGVLFWLEAILFSILSITRIIDDALTNYWDRRKAAKARRALRLFPFHRQSWWHLAKQADDSYASQIHLDIQATNVSDHPIQIIRVRLIKPKAKLINALATLPMEGSPYHSHKHPVPPHGTVRASVSLMVRGKLADQGRPICVTIGITEQYGEEYILKKILIETNDKPSEKSSFLTLVNYPKIIISRLFARRHDSAGPQTPTMPWTYTAGPEYIDICEAVLNEEKRNYAACGRIRGGLGSLNVGLQSEPNYGWTEVGKVPQLLFRKDDGKRISSPNLERLLKIYEGLNDPDRDNLKKYLLSQLRKESPFVEVAYFIFLALHRMDATIDALETARTFLKGDKVFGYSNLLGTLSVLISNEHFVIEPSLYPQILQALEGDEEHDFRLREKINLARLERLDIGNMTMPKRKQNL